MINLKILFRISYFRFEYKFKNDDDGELIMFLPDNVMCFNNFLQVPYCTEK